MIQATHSEPKNKKKALFLQRGGFVPGLDTFEDAVIYEAGLINAARELGFKGFKQLSLEQIHTLEIDILILTEDNGLPSLGSELLKHPLLKRKKMKTVRLAGKNLRCGGPASLEAVKVLNKALGYEIKS